MSDLEIKTKPIYNKKEALKLIFSGEKVFRYVPVGELYYSDKHDEEFQSKGQFIQVFSHEELEEMSENTIFYDNDKSFSEDEYDKILNTEKTKHDFEHYFDEE